MDGTARGHDRDHALGIACGAGAGALWGLVFLAPALAHDATPLQLAVGRYLAFGLLSVALLGRRGRALAASLDRRDLWWLAALALSGNTLYYVLLSTAVQQGGIAMTALVIGFLPVTVTIIGSREAGAVPLARLAPALLLCAAGALCIGWPALATAGGAARAPGGAGALPGLVCAIGALVAWTLYAVGNSRCLARLTRVSVHEWNLLVGVATGVQALALLPFALVPGAGPREPAGWLRLGGVSIAVALLASVAGNALWNRMSRLLPLTLAGQMILFETLFALAYGWWWERRLPRPLELLALVLVVAGVLSCLAAHRAPRLLSAAGARE
jgi:drug/metabolite transporter (DMT)-like permease